MVILPTKDDQDLDQMRARWGFFFGCMESRASETGSDG